MMRLREIKVSLCLILAWTCKRGRSFFTNSSWNARNIYSPYVQRCHLAANPCDARCPEGLPMEQSVNFAAVEGVAWSSLLMRAAGWLQDGSACSAGEGYWQHSHTQQLHVKPCVASRAWLFLGCFIETEVTSPKSDTKQWQTRDRDSHCCLLLPRQHAFLQTECSNTWLINIFS